MTHNCMVCVLQKETEPKPQPEKKKVKGESCWCTRALYPFTLFYSLLNTFDSAFHAAWFVFHVVGTSQEQKGERGSKGQARGGEERGTSGREGRGSCRKRGS